MKVPLFEKERLEREERRERDFKSQIKEVNVIYLAYDDNFIPTLTLA